MPKDWRSTRAWRALVEDCKATYGWTCHLCGRLIPADVPTEHALAYQADHVKPYDTHPALRMALHNLRPSHRQCNRWRGSRELTPSLIAECRARFVPEVTRPALQFFNTR